MTAVSESRKAVLRSGEADQYLSIVLQVPKAPQVAPPTRVALALVIDTSGSMAEDQKIENARFAAASIIEALAPGDEISLTTFETRSEVLAPRTVIDEQTKTRLRGVRQCLLALCEGI